MRSIYHGWGGRQRRWQRTNARRSLTLSGSALNHNEGIILYFARRYDEAIQVFQNVIKMQPDYAIAHVYLGYTYAAKGQYAEAIAAYQKNDQP